VAAVELAVNVNAKLLKAADPFYQPKNHTLIQKKKKKAGGYLAK
jgi:hypothetical protein